MEKIKVHVLHTGEVRVSPNLPFGGYATKSWKEMITSGIALDKAQQKQSLQWIREQAMSPNCVEALASHDTGVKPHVIEF